MPTNPKYTSIANYLFNGCTSLESIEIPSNVTSIGNYAFSGSAISSLVFEVTKEQAPSINWSFSTTMFSSGTNYKLFLPNVTTENVASGVSGSLTPIPPSGVFFHYNGEASTASKAEKINPENYTNQY